MGGGGPGGGGDVGRMGTQDVEGRGGVADTYGGRSEWERRGACVVVLARSSAWYVAPGGVAGCGTRWLHKMAALPRYVLALPSSVRVRESCRRPATLLFNAIILRWNAISYTNANILRWNLSYTLERLSYTIVELMGAIGALYTRHDDWGTIYTIRCSSIIQQVTQRN
jgi:hypothetical protein